MKLKLGAEIPRQRENNSLQKILTEFVLSEQDTAEVCVEDHEFEDLFDEYKSTRVLYSCMWAAAKSSKYNVSVMLRGNRVYLKKTFDWAPHNKKEG